jgi:hypothetical protein
MRVKSIRLQNFRSFADTGVVPLDQINVLIGANNSGKSSVLRGLHLLQHGLGEPVADVRAGSVTAEVDIQLTETDSCQHWGIGNVGEDVVLQVKINSTDRRSGGVEYSLFWANIRQRGGDLRLPGSEPNHFIVPFLSKRKTANYLEDTREQYVQQITSEMTNLSAKLSRLANPQFPAYRQYAEACESILGFVVTSIASPNGQRPGHYLPDLSTIPIDQMGEGVPNIVSFLCSLAVSRGKLFLIEEPENDLHPQALKSLLDLIRTSSDHNQFVISTHSNIVVSHLCSHKNSQLLQITSERGVLPTLAHVTAVPPTPDARIQVLHDLGYAFSDFELSDGWLLLEESSAERILRDYLIPWFTPELRRVRTVAAGGVDSIDPMFSDFHRLVLFAHLQPAYLGRTWVRVDGDAAGRGVITLLRAKYPSFPTDAFQCWQREQFEHYYPPTFSQASFAALSIENKQSRRSAKRDLLLSVIAWIDEDEQRARKEFEESAREVIDDLKAIEAELLAKRGPRSPTAL